MLAADILDLFFGPSARQNDKQNEEEKAQQIECQDRTDTGVTCSSR